MKQKELNTFDKPRNIKIMLGGFFVFLVVLLVLDYFISKHAYFPCEGAPQFFAAYGFVSCVVVITISKILRFFTKRDETYYD